jgi:hypothetical protein
MVDQRNFNDFGGGTNASGFCIEKDWLCGQPLPSQHNRLFARFGPFIWQI